MDTISKKSCGIFRYYHYLHIAVVHLLKGLCLDLEERLLKNLRDRLKPNFEDGTTFSELSIYFELKYFVTEVKVYTKSGGVMKFTHIATYDVVVL